jgi:hypothetical protein
MKKTLKKTFEQTGEYDCLMAEILRRNPEYCKEARAIKNEWDRHVKACHTSDEYVAFCKKWKLKIHHGYFLDPDDLSNSVQRSPFKESPSGHIAAVLVEGRDKEGNVVYRLKPNPDKVYLEIDRFITGA